MDFMVSGLRPVPFDLCFCSSRGKLYLRPHSSCEMEEPFYVL